MLKINVGGMDRIVRVAVGVVLILFALFSNAHWAALGWIGLLPLATGLLRTCPAYTLFGISTCPGQKKTGQ